VALLALGGASLQNFAFALLVGICSGGYHSIFYSAPLVAKLQNAQRARAHTGSSNLEQPRTKAEARQQAAKAAGAAVPDRDAVLAARKARRERERSATQRTGAPARYKRRRPDDSPTSAIGIADPGVEHGYDDAALDDLESEHEIADGEQLDRLDPLDAQNAGQHERDFDLGHEEIHLNLEAVDAPHYVAPPAAHVDSPPGDAAK
jgi:hypothetical protein